MALRPAQRTPISSPMRRWQTMTDGRTAPPGRGRDRWRLGGLVALAAAVALAAVGCGGGGTLAGREYTDPEAEYRIGELGPGWERLGIGDNDLAWHNAEIGAVVQVNATCDPFQDVPLTSLTNHLLIGFTDRDYISSDRVPLDGREALRSHVVASLDGVPRELLLFVMKKNRCTYDFALIAPPGESYRRAEPRFEAFVSGFTTEVATP